MEKFCQPPHQYIGGGGRKRIFKQLFDVRPMTKGGDLDMEKILLVKEVLNLRGELTDREASVRSEAVKIPVISRDTEEYTLLLGEESRKDWRDFKKEIKPEEQKPKKETPKRVDYRWEDEYFKEEERVPEQPEEEIPSKEDILDELGSVEYSDERLKEKMGTVEPQPIDVETQFIEPEEEEVEEELEEKPIAEAKPREIPRGPRLPRDILVRLRPIAGFALIVLILTSLLAGSILFIKHSSEAKEKVATAGAKALQHLQRAKLAVEVMDFSRSSSEFELAYKNFALANQSLGSVGRLMITLLGNFPGGSSLTQGQLLLDLGEDLALAGKNLTEGFELLTRAKLSPAAAGLNFALPELDSTYSLSEAIIGSQELFRIAEARISQAQVRLKKIDFEKLPEEFRESIEGLSSQLPQIQEILAGFLESEDLILGILGHGTPRKYLLLFQNNGEMRPTGGFVGTYGILDLDQGRIQGLFVEGIFNPDGQLSVKVVPPKPIQKISAAWSMHDANWFADFPTSARKVAWFYEKTGGPTVDGVIALTNEVLVRLLEITGPIEMPSYGVVIDSNNFTEITQYLVEVAYDKEENRPKQFIADLAPQILVRIFSGSTDNWFKLLDVFSQNLKEKHILLFFFDEDLEEKILEKGWAGEVLEASKDYLSVVNSNINGYKTDAVIAEVITHLAEIEKDGSIIDTLTITRRHLGGETHYDWWNKVNSNWLRVYVPKGAELLEAKGHTPEEEYIPSIDYSWFTRDPLVEKIEGTMIRDDAGTYIFEETGKTVFGNWVYVSPGEEVTVTYKYKLPFKIDTTEPADTYSMLVQKQSGSKGSKFKGEIKFPKGWEVLQSTSEDLGLETDLSVDRFYGATFGF